MNDPNFKGFGGVPLVYVKKEVTTTASGGVVTREFWEGRQAEVEAKQLVFVGAGWATDVTHEGPLYKLTATIGLDTTSGGSGGEGGGTETPTVQWSWATENLTRDAWSHPLVTLEADTYVSPAQYRTEIEQAVNEGKALSLNQATLPTSHKLYRELVRGFTGYETEYFVLTRTRIYSPQYPVRYPMTANMVVYSTAKLIDVFDLPSVVQAALPAVPDAFPAPEQAMWGWRIRDFSNEYDGQNRITERVSWVFAIWSTFYYQPNA